MTRKPDPVRVSPVFAVSGERKGNQPRQPQPDDAARFEQALEKARRDATARKGGNTPRPRKG